MRAIAVLLFIQFFAGCAGSYLGQDQLAGQIKVFGIEMHSTTDYLQINGVDAVEEPCLRGYERTFASLGVSIGYGFDKKVRKIVTRNPKTSLFGISPGFSLEAGEENAIRMGFKPGMTPNVYLLGSYSLKFLTGVNNSIEGMILELSS